MQHADLKLLSTHSNASAGGVFLPKVKWFLKELLARKEEKKKGVTAGWKRLMMEEGAGPYLRVAGGQGRRGSDLPALTTGIPDAGVLSRTGWGLHQRRGTKHSPVT